MGILIYTSGTGSLYVMYYIKEHTTDSSAYEALRSKQIEIIKNDEDNFKEIDSGITTIGEDNITSAFVEYSATYEGQILFQKDFLFYQDEYFVRVFYRQNAGIEEFIERDTFHDAIDTLEIVDE